MSNFNSVEYFFVLDYGESCSCSSCCCDQSCKKIGILVSRIPDIFCRKSGHFQMVVINLSIFGIKRLQYCSFKTQFNSKWMKFSRKQAYIYSYDSYCYENLLIHDSEFSSGKSGYRTKKVFSQLCVHLAYRDIFSDNFKQIGYQYYGP